jgi:superfamily II DNA or RNA helicase
MLEALFVLFLCSTQQPECQVLVVVPTLELCEQQKATLIEARGKPPKELSLNCQAYEKSSE